MEVSNRNSCRLAGLCLCLSLVGLGGCSHGSDDTGGNSSMGSMSGTTGRQYTQSNANQSTPVGASGSSAAGSGSASSTGAVSSGGSGSSGASMGTTGSGAVGSGSGGSVGTGGETRDEGTGGKQ